MTETCACGKHQVPAENARPASGGCGCGGKGHGGHGGHGHGHGGGGCGCGGKGHGGHGGHGGHAHPAQPATDAPPDLSDGRENLGLRSAQ